MVTKRRTLKLSATQCMQQVRLPEEFADRAQTIATNLRKDTLYHYHKHRIECNGRVDSKQWKCIKEKHQLAVYKHLKNESSSSSSSHGPEIMAIGAIPGSLDDVLHGVVNVTPNAMQIENAFAEGDLGDARLLAILSPPTSSTPFDTLTVKWVVRSHSGISKQRDYVYIEATGVIDSSNGEKIGYRLLHSVTLAAVPEFRKDSNILRGHLSCCFLYRPRRQHGVEVYFRGTVNPKGSIKERVATNIAVDMILSCSTSIQYAMMKKLSFSLQSLSNQDTESSSVVIQSRGSHSSSNSEQASSVRDSGRSRSTTRSSVKESLLRRAMSQASLRNTDDRRLQNISMLETSHAVSACAACVKPFSTFSGRSRCQLCLHLICGRCRITKRVYGYEENVLHPEKLDFCTECIATTSNTSTAWVAAQELQQLEHLFVTAEEQDRVVQASLHKAIQGRPRYESSSDDRTTISTTYSSSRTSSNYFDSNSRYWTNMSVISDDQQQHTAQEPHEYEELGASACSTDGAGGMFAHSFASMHEDCPIIEPVIDDELDDVTDELVIGVPDK